MYCIDIADKPNTKLLFSFHWCSGSSSQWKGVNNMPMSQEILLLGQNQTVKYKACSLLGYWKLEQLHPDTQVRNKHNICPLIHLNSTSVYTQI